MGIGRVPTEAVTQSCFVLKAPPLVDLCLQLVGFQ